MIENTRQYDVVIIGAGLVGLATAYQYARNRPDRKVLIIEKESTVAAHQSGHNSGVMHSGVYYTPNTLKAQNCMSGYQELLRFAKQYSIPHDVCGKLIVASDESEVPVLQRIQSNGRTNGLKNLVWMKSDEMSEVEPHVSGVAALHVPQAGIVDFPAVAQQLAHLFTRDYGGDVTYDEEVIAIKPDGQKQYVETTKGQYLTQYVVSCAGLHSDRVTTLTEKTSDLRVIPFRGEYYKIRPEKEYLVNNLIYPVPNTNFPFLGVHFTRMIRGGIEAGPNAVLAFQREGYTFSDFSFQDFMETVSWPGFWKIALKYGRTGLWEMYRSLSKSTFTRSLQKLIPEIQEEDIEDGGSGVRAQACDRRGNLVYDYRIHKSGPIIHVQNAPSPAATSCLSIGKSISDLIQ